MNSLDIAELLADTTCSLIAASGYMVSRSGYRECTSFGIIKPRSRNIGIIESKYLLSFIVFWRLGAVISFSAPDWQSRRSRSANERSYPLATDPYTSILYDPLDFSSTAPRTRRRISCFAFDSAVVGLIYLVNVASSWSNLEHMSSQVC